MLETVTERREALQARIKNFTTTPAGLRIKVDGQPVVFPIDEATGMVSSTPTGAWGWVKGFRWLDLKDYLKNVHRYEVEVMPRVAAGVLV
jgi:hypothetical protein